MPRGIRVLTPKTPHGQALEQCTELVELIHLVSKTFPAHEDMVLVPEIRQTVVDLHKAVMMAGASNNQEDYDAYTDDIRGKSARLSIQMDISFAQGHVSETQQHKIFEYLDGIYQVTLLSYPSPLTLVKG